MILGAFCAAFGAKSRQGRFQEVSARRRGIFGVPFWPKTGFLEGPKMATWLFHLNELLHKSWYDFAQGAQKSFFWGCLFGVFFETEGENV